MNDTIPTTSSTQTQGPYEAPALVCFGTLSDLTLAGSGSQPEGGAPLPSKHV